MGYTELLRRAAEIAWRHRWLWLLAFLAGEAGGGLPGASRGFNLPVNSPAGFGAGGFGGNGQAAPSPDGAAITQWLGDHAGLLVAIAVALLLLYVVLFIVSCIAVAAAIRGVDEIEAGRTGGLGRAWGLGVARFGPVLRLRLLLLLLGVLAALLVLALVGLGALAAATRAWLALAILVYHGLGLGLEFTAIGLVLGVALPVATRAAALDALGARLSLVRAYRLLLTRTGRVIACWALMLACQIAYGLVLGLASLLFALPLIGLLAAGFAGGPMAATIVAAVLVGLVVVAVLLVASAAFAAFYSSFWTLAYRRLDAA